MSIGADAHVEAVMTTPVKTISADATLREAASRMRSHDIRSLLVPGAETGTITSTDILDAVADDRDVDQNSVEDVMTAGIEWVGTDLRLQEAAAMMTNFGINHLPVRDDDGDYVGMVSSTDLNEILADS